MKPLLTVDVFRSKAVELKPAYQPFLSLIRKWIWERKCRREGGLSHGGCRRGNHLHVPAAVINLGNVREAITIMAALKSSILILVTYLVLLNLMIYRGPNGILSPSFFSA